MAAPATPPVSWSDPVVELARFDEYIQEAVDGDSLAQDIVAGATMTLASALIEGRTSAKQSAALFDRAVRWASAADAASRPIPGLSHLIDRLVQHAPPLAPEDLVRLADAAVGAIRIRAPGDQVPGVIMEGDLLRVHTYSPKCHTDRFKRLVHIDAVVIDGKPAVTLDNRGSAASGGTWTSAYLAELSVGSHRVEIDIRWFLVAGSWDEWFPQRGGNTIVRFVRSGAALARRTAAPVPGL